MRVKAEEVVEMDPGIRVFGVTGRSHLCSCWKISSFAVCLSFPLSENL